jgi:predicted ester cyclase
MAAENAALVRRWFDEVWNQRIEQTIDDLIGPDSVCYSDTDEMRGTEGFRAKQYAPFVAAFPDLRVKIDDLVADQDVVVVRWSAEGTHTGHGVGCSPTGRKVRFEGMSWIHIKGGVLDVGWQWSNIPRVLASLQACHG